MVLVKEVSDEDVQHLVEECKNKGGVPVIITRYAGFPIRHEGRPAVVFCCYGIGDPKGVLLVGISKKLWKKFDKSIVER